MADEERRKSVRIKKVIIVRYSEDKQKWDISNVKDICENGMCLTTPKQFLPNDVLTLLIKIPSLPLEWIEITGRVVGSDEIVAASGSVLGSSYITRVEFVNIEEKYKGSIREYIAWFLSKQGGEQK